MRDDGYFTELIVNGLGFNFTANKFRRGNVWLYPEPNGWESVIKIPSKKRPILRCRGKSPDESVSKLKDLLKYKLQVIPTTKGEKEQYLSMSDAFRSLRSWDGSE